MADAHAEINRPRYTNLPLPGYRFIPGKSPHPTRDTDGHSYNKQPGQVISFNPDEWLSCEEYLYGIDLFNHEYWWEAHEALEAVWMAAGRRTRTGLFIQGLIQIAAAHLKWFQGFNDTAGRMSSEGLEKMQQIKGTCMGIEVEIFRSDINAYFAGKTETPTIINLDLRG